MQKKEYNELDFLVNYIPYKILLTLIFAAAYFTVFDAKLDLNGDNAAYYNLGKALASGQGFVNTALPGQPPESHFPVGYPLIIAGLIKAGINTFAGLKIANGLLLYFSGMLWFQIIQMIGFRKNTAFVTVTALFLSPLLMRFGTIMMSECAFLFFSSLHFYSLLRSEPKDGSGIFKNPFFYIALLCGVAAFYIKTPGFILTGALLLHFLLRKKYTAAGMAALLTVLLVLPVFLQPAGGENYVHQLMMINPYSPDQGLAGPGDLLERIWNNFINYGFGVIQSVVFPLSSKYLRDVLFIDIVTGSVMLYFIYRGIKHIKQFREYIFGVLLLTAFVLLLWPSVWTSPRYVVYAAPFLLLIFFTGITDLTEKNEKHIPGKKPLGVFPVFLLALISIIPLNDIRLKAAASHPPQWEKYFEAARWASKNTNDSARFVARKPNLFHIRANRTAINYKNVSNDTLQMDHFASNKIDYVVLDRLGYGSTPQYLFPVLEKHALCFRNVKSFPEEQTYVLSFDRELYLSSDYYEHLEKRTDSLQNTIDQKLNDSPKELPDILPR